MLFLISQPGRLWNHCFTKGRTFGCYVYKSGLEPRPKGQVGTLAINEEADLKRQVMLVLVT